MKLTSLIRLCVTIPKENPEIKFKIKIRNEECAKRFTVLTAMLLAEAARLYNTTRWR